MNDVVIESTPVFVDPFQEVDEQLDKEREQLAEQKSQTKDKTTKVDKDELSSNQIENCKRKVGALINLDKLAKLSKASSEGMQNVKKKKVKTDFGNFSNW